MNNPSVSGDVAALSRRRFMKAALVVSAAGVVAFGGTIAWLARSPKDKQPRPTEITALNDAEYHLFVAVCAACLPMERNVAGLLPWTGLPVVANVDHLIAGIPAHARGDVTKAFQLLDYGPIVSGWHGRRFVDLDVETAREFLGKWNRGGEIQRAVSNLARRLVYVAYWQESATWPAIGYQGPVMQKWGIERYGNAPLPDAVAKPLNKLSTNATFAPHSATASGTGA